MGEAKTKPLRLLSLAMAVSLMAVPALDADLNG